MDILPLLDELRTIARNGLTYSTNPYDIERYTRLMDLTTEYYGQALELPPHEVRARLAAELGYITPKVGANAALFDDEGRILLIQRSDDATWGLPGGWLAPNETPMQGAERETREETGLEVRATRLIDVFARAPGADSGTHSVVSILYLCERLGGTPQASHESLDVRFWRIEDVPVWHHRHEEYARRARAVWEGRTSPSSPSP